MFARGRRIWLIEFHIAREEAISMKFQILRATPMRGSAKAILGVG
jgi:hypothetical protein